jgi:hypothetical protein
MKTEISMEELRNKTAIDKVLQAVKDIPVNDSIHILLSTGSTTVTFFDDHKIAYEYYKLHEIDRREATSFDNETIEYAEQKHAEGYDAICEDGKVAKIVLSKSA